MFPRTLFSRLALSLTLLLAGIGLLYVLLSTSMTRHYQQEFVQSLNRDLASKLVIGRNLLKDGMLDQKALKETFNHYMMVNPDIEIYLLDRSGRILSYSADPGQVKRERVDLTPVKQFFSGEAFPLLGDDPRSYERRKVFSAARLTMDDGTPAYLYVVLRGQEYERLEELFQNNFLLQLSGASLLASLVVGLLFGLVVFRLLTRRLNRLAGLMQRFSESDFGEPVRWPVESRRSDEIESLGESFNRMAECIQEQIEALKKQDSLRRELVANVSHDLRTPLAALHGYIETLQIKAEAFDAETRSSYLHIALQHSRRLTRLVDELFELAKLDASDSPVQTEPFAVAELAQDIIQKFQLQAEQKGVRLSLECDDSLPFVDGDIALIDRVLVNLISNALRHTPEGGRITVSLRQEDSAVRIQVEDTGSGIPEEDIPKIFERFYRGDNAARSGHHAGLGLAIARHIVRLHGGVIRVSSKPGQGARFEFSLNASVMAS
ncbi:phospho-acceptor domain-containing protein [Thiogranum longum]|uniref:histidine kinase n=1 Tax=Thiogranum longum TaxID=1537524 RepID=A0A4R1HAE6_9GAMM|nr:ATP-binding protein [Thiogranum longum]TCK18907.1 phospho-acceptor domain-containing protein [Thiogranum longum]